MLITIENASKAFGAQEVFEGVTAKIEDYSRIGLIGVNGAGKSTLLNIICGALESDSGIVSRKKDLRIGYLRQNSGLNDNSEVMEEMRSVFSYELELERDISRLSNLLADNPQGKEHDRLTEELAAAQSLFEARDGYNIDVRINMVLSGMGFSEIPKDKLISTMSGGEKTRLAICKLLLENPDLLILDEPTNHLDFRTLLWLEDYLASYKGALLIVSHDRYFLEKLCGCIWELEHGKFYEYPGSYSKYVQLRSQRIEYQQKVWEMQQQEIADLTDYVARNMARVSTSGMAKSRQKTLDKMEIIERPKAPPAPMKISFELKSQPVKAVLEAKDLHLWVGEGEGYKSLASNIDLEVQRGEKVAFVGPNGAGKTTLLRALQGLCPYSGNAEWGKNVKTAYFDQTDSGLNLSNTAIDEVWSGFPNEFEHTIRTVLGGLGITGEEVYKLVGQLSGGEKARIKFARMMLAKANVLILDEPTNHLDLDAKESLDNALRDYEGTVIMVSHDRYLLDHVPDRIVEFSSAGLVSYKGGFSDYIEKADLRPKSSKQVRIKEETENKKTFYRSKEQRKLEAKLRNELSSTEQSIATTEEEIEELERQLSDPEVSSNFEQLTSVCSMLEEKRSHHAHLMENWLTLNEQLGG